MSGWCESAGVRCGVECLGLGWVLAGCVVAVLTSEHLGVMCESVRFALNLFGFAISVQKYSTVKCFQCTVRDFSVVSTVTRSSQRANVCKLRLSRFSCAKRRFYCDTSSLVDGVFESKCFSPCHMMNVESACLFF